MNATLAMPNARTNRTARTNARDESLALPRGLDLTSLARVALAARTTVSRVRRLAGELEIRPALIVDDRALYAEDDARRLIAAASRNEPPARSGQVRGEP